MWLRSKPQPFEIARVVPRVEARPFRVSSEYSPSWRDNCFFPKKHLSLQLGENSEPARNLRPRDHLCPMPGFASLSIHIHNSLAKLGLCLEICNDRPLNLRRLGGGDRERAERNDWDGGRACSFNFLVD